MRVAVGSLVALALAVSCGDKGPVDPGAAETILVSVPATTLAVGHTMQATATLTSANGAESATNLVTWSSSKTSVATVSLSGLITGTGPGVATISAKMDGHVASQDLTVAVPVVQSLIVIPGPAWLLVGGTAQLVVSGVDQFGLPIPVASSSYTLSSGSSVTLSPTGLVTAQQLGSSTIGVSASGLATSTTANVVSPSTISGTTVVAGTAPPTGLVASIQMAAASAPQIFSSPLSSGAFTISYPQPTGLTDSVNIVVDAAASSRVFRPVYARVAAATAALYAARPLLVPETIVVPSGDFANQSVTISLNSAFAPMCADITDTNCNSYFPRVWKTLVALWAEGELPVPLAFNRAASGTATISATDSASLWAVIHGMESVLGMQLFRPVNFESLPTPNSGGFSSHAVLVSIDATLAANSGFTSWTWGGDGNMTGAKTRVAGAAALSSTSLMSHELLHALGFHHTCAWPSVMAYANLGCTRSSAPTRTDVAAFNLGYLVRRAMLAGAPSTGLLAALQGERVFELGLAAGSQPSLLIGANAARVVNGQLVFADSAH